ncbi:unnamed protein product [Leuciscus chuanchicus]
MGRNALPRQKLLFWANWLTTTASLIHWDLVHRRAGDSGQSFRSIGMNELILMQRAGRKEGRAKQREKMERECQEGKERGEQSLLLSSEIQQKDYVPLMCMHMLNHCCEKHPNALCSH